MNFSLVACLAVAVVYGNAATVGSDASSEAYIKNYIDENQNELYETILMNFIGEHRRQLSRKQLEVALNKIDQLEPYYITLKIYRSLCSIYKQGESITHLDDAEFQLIAERINREFNGFYPVQDVFQICRINRLAISERLMKVYSREARDNSWSCYEDFGPDELTTTEPFVTTPLTFNPVSVRTVIPITVTEPDTVPPTQPATTTPMVTTTTTEATTATTEAKTTSEATTKEQTTTEELCLGDCVPDTVTPPIDPGYSDEFLAQFVGIHFARSAHEYYVLNNQDEKLEKCVYKINSTDNYIQDESIEYTLALDLENTAENVDCPVSRKCKAVMEGENYVVKCDDVDDMAVIEDNTDGAGGDQNGGNGSNTENEFEISGSGGSGSASGSGSGFSGSGIDFPIDNPEEKPESWEGKGWKLPLLIILIVLLVCAILACLFCVVCKKNKDDVQYVEAQEAR